MKDGHGPLLDGLLTRARPKGARVAVFETTDAVLDHLRKHLVSTPRRDGLVPAPVDVPHARGTHLGPNPGTSLFATSHFFPRQIGVSNLWAGVDGTTVRGLASLGPTSERSSVRPLHRHRL